MPRAIGYEDTTIVAGFGGKRDKNKYYRGKSGEKHIVRLVGEVFEQRQHKVFGIIPDDPKTHEPRPITINCCKVWNPTAGEDGKGDYEGKCKGCEDEDELTVKYVSGLLFLGIVSAKGNVSPIQGPASVKIWDFGADKYRTISDINLDLKNKAAKRGDGKRGKIQLVDLVIQCDDDHYQKLKISVQDSSEKSLLTQAHADVWKAEEGTKAVADEIKETTPAEWARRTKKKKAAPAQAGEEAQAGGDGENAPEDLGLVADEVEVAPTPAPKPAPKPAAKKPAPKPAPAPAPEPEPEAVEEATEEVGEVTVEDEVEAPAPPPKPAPKPAAKAPAAPAKKPVTAKAAPAPAAEPSTGDEVIDGLLTELGEVQG